MIKFVRGVLTSVLILSLPWTSFGQASLWGEAMFGGRDHLGTIFRTDPDGTHFTIAHEFTTEFPGRNPYGDLVEINGKFYGLTYGGGHDDLGILFEFDPSTGHYTVKQEFGIDSFLVRFARLFKGANNRVYGLLSSGGIFEYDVSSNQIIDRANGYPNPGKKLCHASNGKYYGTYSSYPNVGIFEFDEQTNVSTPLALVSASSIAYLVEGADGILYGLASLIEDPNSGAIIEFNVNTGQISVPAYFRTASAQGLTGLCLAPNGKLYGVDPGFPRPGSIFEFDPASDTITNNIEFTDPNSSLGGPLAVASNGKLYGMGLKADGSGGGIIYEYDATLGALKVVQDRSGIDGVATDNGFLLGTDGILHAMTSSGGTGGDGTIFDFDPVNNLYTKKIDLNSGPLGKSPRGRLLPYTDGKMYGFADGGNFGKGILFRYNPGDGQFEKLQDFGGSNGISNWSFGLMMASNGKLYGTSTEYPASTLFEYDPLSNTFPKGNKMQVGSTTILAGGTLPIEAQPGKLFGFCRSGVDPFFSGNIYEYDIATGQVSLLHEFTTNEGTLPLSTMAFENGKLYGTASSGGAFDKGTFFSFDISTSTYQKILDFNGINGHTPYAGPVTMNHKVYGSTSSGGANGTGVVFEWDPATSIMRTKDFPRSDSPGLVPLYPNGEMIAVADNTLYGICSGSGIIYIYDPIENTLVCPESVAGNNYAVMSTLAATGLNQTITFDAIPAKKFGDNSFALQSTSSSGLPVSFKSSDPSIAMISGNNVTITGAGTVTITAVQKGNNIYLPSQRITQTLVVAKATQAITFNALANHTYGDQPFLLSAVSGSGLPVTFTSNNAAVAAVAGNQVTITGIGSATITAQQTGDNNYLPAQPVDRILLIGKMPQSIIFDAPRAHTCGDAPFLLAATSDAGLPITFTVDDPSIASVAGQTLTILNEGSVTITATQSGGDTFLPAVPVQRTLTVSKKNQQITFSPLNNMLFGDAPVTLNASSTSGLDVVMSSSDQQIASINGQQMNIAGAGTVTITASQPGNECFSQAAPVSNTFSVAKASQIITFTDPGNKKMGDPDFQLIAQSNSAEPLIFSSSDDNKIDVTGSLARLAGPGRVVLRVDQTGTADYMPANASRSICVVPATPAITIESSGPLSAVLRSSSDVGNQWILNGQPITSGTAATFMADADGSYQVQVTVDDCRSELSLPIGFTVTGLRDNGETSPLTIYPNPASDRINVDLTGFDSAAPVKISIMDMLGRIVLAGEFPAKQVEINLSMASGSVYALKAVQTERLGYARFVMK